MKCSLSSPDSLLQQPALEILGNLLLFDSKWDEFLRLAESDPHLFTATKLDDSDRIFAKAMRQAPEERYSFPDEATTVPTRLNRVGLPLLEISVNGIKKNFLLDTGASQTVIASTIAEECGIEPLGSEIGQGTTSTSITIAFQPAVIRELKIGDLKINNHPAAIVDERSMTKAKFVDVNPVLPVRNVAEAIEYYDVDKLFEEYQEMDVFHARTALRNTSWGTREFAFYDPDKTCLDAAFS